MSDTSGVERGSDLGRQLNEARQTISLLADQRGLALRIEALRAAAHCGSDRLTFQENVAGMLEVAEPIVRWLETGESKER